eukprot:TRINITY_DN76528_c0_g1_i1.p1 TRINITY_DN76528_c0_g1~~TRINITY_DN76528_c0_g1_i1.p1  ORF type:complete len:237 (+),score=39.57 TRINITY_DN76528_c0_g1_i1:203-913(+)
MRSTKQGVTFEEFPAAQFASIVPASEEPESFNGFEFVFYSIRIRDAQRNPHFINAYRAHSRAATLRRAVETDLALNWQDGAEVIEVPNEEEIPAEQEPLPMQPPDLVQRTEKVVRFSDEVDAREFQHVPMKQCELCSPHELCLNAFVSRVESAKVSPNMVNASDARERGTALRAEVEVEKREEQTGSEAMKPTFADDLWLVVDTPSDEGFVDASSRAESMPPERQEIGRASCRERV